MIGEDGFKLPDSYFKLTVSEPVDWGYWKTSSKSINRADFGYELNLIVNGKNILTTPIVLSPFTEHVFNPSMDMRFIGNVPNIGDTIQASIQTWVTDNSGETIRSANKPKMTNAICLLNKPYRIFLNTGNG